LNSVTTGRIEWASTGALVDEVFFGSERVPILSPKTAFLRELRRLFPSEAAALRRYPWVVRWAHVTLGLQLVLRMLPWACGAPLQWLLGSMQTTKTGLKALTTDVRLQQALSYIWGTYGVSPSRSPLAFHLVLQNHYFNGGFYPAGGCSQLAARIIPTITKAGGAVLVRARVSSLAIDEQTGAVCGVIIRDKTIQAKRVVSAVGAINTFCRLVPATERHRLEPILRTIRNAPPIAPPVDSERQVEPSVAFVYLFLGINGEDSPVELPKHNIWSFADWDHEATCALPATLGDVGEEHPLLLFISSPSAKDPTWAMRKGHKQVVLALAPTRYEYWASWSHGRIKHRGKDYDGLKKRLTTRMIDAVLAKLPQLMGRIDYVDLGTPLSNDYYLGTSWGEAYGLSHTPARFSQPWLTPQTPLKNLFLSGQDIATDGVTGGVLSGFLSAAAIDKSVWVAEASGLLAAGMQTIMA